MTKETKKQFLDEIIELSKKYKLTISHEDSGGCFLIQEYNEDNIDWLKYADYGIYYK